MLAVVALLVRLRLGSPVLFRQERAGLEMDVWYVENRSLLLDLKILWCTLKVVVSREGVAEDGRATMTEFLGTDS